jgi:hypothetical protein
MLFSTARYWGRAAPEMEQDMSDWSDYTDAASDLDAASTELTTAAGDIADAQWYDAQGDGWADWSADSLNEAAQDYAQGYDTFGDSALEQAGTYADLAGESYEIADTSWADASTEVGYAADDLGSASDDLGSSSDL